MNHVNENSFQSTCVKYPPAAVRCTRVLRVTVAIMTRQVVFSALLTINVTSSAQSNLGRAASQSPHWLQWDAPNSPPNCHFPFDDHHLIHPSLYRPHSPTTQKDVYWKQQLYGCETWTYNKNVRDKLLAFEMYCYRRILRISWTGQKQTVK